MMWLDQESEVSSEATNELVDDAMKRAAAENKVSALMQKASLPKRSNSASSLDWMGQQRRVEEPPSPVRVSPISRQVLQRPCRSPKRKLKLGIIVSTQ